MTTSISTSWIMCPILCWKASDAWLWYIVASHTNSTEPWKASHSPGYDTLLLATQTLLCPKIISSYFSSCYPDSLCPSWSLVTTSMLSSPTELFFYNSHRWVMSLLFNPSMPGLLCLTWNHLAPSMLSISEISIFCGASDPMKLELSLVCYLLPHGFWKLN